MDLEQRKRKIFIQNISSKTTKRSLQNYFSSYLIDWCTVPCGESGKNKMHGIVMFSTKESVDAVMAKRIHRIDGQEVFIHRSVPSQKSGKDSLGIQQLIVSSLNNQSLVELELKEYFASYGAIDEMKMDGKKWIITFDDYDSVDKIMLDMPHRIGPIDVTVEKGDRDMQGRWSFAAKPTFNTQNNNNTGAVPKKSNLKVTMSEQVACLNLPERRYRIHITNLPRNTDAGSLSEAFEWDIYDIVMNPSVGDRTSSAQCWLKNAIDEEEVDNFIRRWNRKIFMEFTIECNKEEDELELCNKFQFGRCRKNSTDCDWEHITCTANGACASTCPYGHPFGMKSRDTSRSNIRTTNTNYRVKLSGFRTQVTPLNLAQRFSNHNYYVDPNHDRVGYIVKIQTMKYARQLMAKWHNKNIDDQNITCQLEINPISPSHRNISRSEAGSIDKERKRNRSCSRPRDARSVHSSQGTSDLGDINNTISMKIDNREFDKDLRISAKAIRDVTSNTEMKYKLRSVISTNKLPSDVPTDKWEVTKKAPNSDGKLLLICSKLDQNDLAVIKTYPKEFLNNFQHEITIMKDLKDVKGVYQLIEPENISNNLVQRCVNSECLWMIMKRAPGYSLKEFIEQTCQGPLDILSAIQLTLNLMQIIQHVHKKGLFHLNLSPENIMIERNLRVSYNRAQLTILNFNQATIVSDRTYIPVTTSAQKWYHARQIDDKGLSSTIDPSTICAILFWLLTGINPQHDNDALPHQQAREKLDGIIKTTAEFVGMSQQIVPKEQLKMYLMNTFDRAFGYPHHHPWTINDLECRLKSILQLLTPIEPNLDTTDSIFQELISISDVMSIPPIATGSTQRDAFAIASETFYQAKKHFLDNEPNKYEWSDGHCIWVYNPHSSINERHNHDILTYHFTRGRTTTSYSVIIMCLASCSEEGSVMTLSIGSDVNGKTIRMPIGQYSTAQDYIADVQEKFKTELRNLLLAIYSERKTIQHQ
ncbi:unnamed protein product [Adineta steineri]|uniref:Uncharacterized protein n=1 Tax=Adineta steineri TaxID=433720 RepID=A0A814I247_9BILA|nr:unnamed protein product [Adineta steineri]CAF1053773.1 unnamed protein product [Adineta steineri]CAF3557486.1 unnamed protein product [Adineta steineri]CAF3675068.1 unnamed protein product [Adineta steineri]